MAVKEKVEAVIRVIAPDAEFHLRKSRGRIAGSVIAAEFEDMTHLARQTAVWELIRSKLGEESSQVGILLLYSPEEWDAVDQEAS